MGDRDIDGGGRYVLTLKSMHIINLITLKLMGVAIRTIEENSFKLIGMKIVCN